MFFPLLIFSFTFALSFILHSFTLENTALKDLFFTSQHFFINAPSLAVLHAPLAHVSSLLSSSAGPGKGDSVTSETYSIGYTTKFLYSFLKLLDSTTSIKTLSKTGIQTKVANKILK